MCVYIIYNSYIVYNIIFICIIELIIIGMWQPLTVSNVRQKSMLMIASKIEQPLMT